VYSTYFGLKEPSFSITPDPQYLFLSEQHREALAHLLYGAGESGGFVLLTGEVGTGKTTICRAFLEQLPDEVVVALILNPAMTVTELLRAVCDEFRITLGGEDRTIKRLVDRLNGFLLDAHAKGLRPVLLIDEAQNLKPRVLEQVRLLTNLETAKHKLLQIFLVGQPELRTLLQGEELRQLNQRITARYHLRPFTARDTTEYVRHRLAVAGVERPLFTRGALRRVHQISGGVPRLINILCDRALLGACVSRGTFVTRKIVGRAAREVRDDVAWPRYLPGAGVAALAAAVLILAMGAGWSIHAWISGDGFSGIPRAMARLLPVDAFRSVPGVETEGGSPTGAGEVGAAMADLDEEPGPAIDLSGLLMERTPGMRVLLRRWGVELGKVGSKDPCEKLSTFGLRCEEATGGWSSLRTLDRPALVRLGGGEQGKAFAAVGVLGEDYVIFDLPDGSRRVVASRLDPDWRGAYLVVWQPPPFGSGVIGPAASGESVRWLRKLLSQVPGLEVKDNGSGRFDASLDRAIRRFQESNGLEVDGVAGPRTLIRLHNAVSMPGVPRLAAAP
jgi:general secretion pathway protein A